MKEIELLLTPTPGAKPEFLATLQEESSSSGLSALLPSKIVMEDYTRDAWAVPSLGVKLAFQNVHPKNKLPGFLQYLQQRKKSAYGRFPLKGKTALCLIHVQANPDSNTTRLHCQIALDATKIPNSPFYKKTDPPKQQPQPQRAPPPNQKKKSGLLGNLVGAQRRTNEHVIQTQHPQAVTTSTNDTTPSKTYAQVLAEFRHELEQQLLDFDLQQHESVLKVNVKLNERTQGLNAADKEKVTMSVLKYVILEQVEEVNEEWIVFKEPSEFMDEAIFSIYKEGMAPPEVMEEINKGDMPDEIKGQQRAIVEERQRQAALKQAKLDQQLQSQALKSETDDLEQLNTNKRDRRTIEEIQREMIQGPTSKKSRV